MEPSNRAERRAAERLKAATRGGVLLGDGGVDRIRNPLTGRILPCCYRDCDKDADNRYRYETPHDAPRWRDETTGTQEMLVYTFCSSLHKGFYIQDLAQS